MVISEPVFGRRGRAGGGDGWMDGSEMERRPGREGAKLPFRAPDHPLITARRNGPRYLRTSRGTSKELGGTSKTLVGTSIN